MAKDGALSPVRLHLAIGSGHFAEARGFAAALRAVAAAPGLKCTLMRAIALSATLEIRAGKAVAPTALPTHAHVRIYASSVEIGNQAGEGPRNPAEFLDSSFRLPKSARPPVIVPEAVAFKLRTMAGLS